MKNLPMIALRGLTAFPNTTLHFDVSREISVKALNFAVDNNSELFVVMQKNISDKLPKSVGDFCATGVIVKVKHVLKVPGDVVRVLVEGVERAKISDVSLKDGFLLAVVDETPTLNSDEISATALMRRCKDAFSEYGKLNNKIVKEILSFVMANADPVTFADMIANVMPSEYKQKYLDELDLVMRLTDIFNDLTREIEISKVDAEINKVVKNRIDKSQKEYYLREQIKAIHDELGDDEEPDDLKIKIDGLKAPDEIKQKLLKEWQRMSKLPQMSPEMTVQRNYLEFALELPWGVVTEDNFDLKNAAKVLDRDHFGLEKLKERILEYLAVKKLGEGKNATVLCLVGPPGVGKTSIVKSIAEALGRKYVRLSLGGMHDEAEIRGHRKTYVGAMAGRILTGIRNAGTVNPVFLLDEIDKLASDYKGDPSSALLEVLDPEQNDTFRDNFLELPFDLSKVLFITTANSPDLIPDALYDRMEIIEMTGYTEEEKREIALRHLVKKEVVKNGVKGKVKFEKSAITAIIENYTRESGVRSLEREIGRVCAKCARRILENEEENIVISSANIQEFLGVPRFKHEGVLKKDEIGAATGLAWTAVGGETLTIEVKLLEGKGDVILTGHLGDVMKESARTALSLVMSESKKYGIPSDSFKNNDVHIHVPEGATPKDGPSAGITMATAILSAFTGIAVKSGVAMTGEITLRGKVLPIGGLKEKTLAAFREGIKTVIIPQENAKDIPELPESVKKHLDFVTVSDVKEVFENALAKNKVKK